MTDSLVIKVDGSNVFKLFNSPSFRHVDLPGLLTLVDVGRTAECGVEYGKEFARDRSVFGRIGTQSSDRSCLIVVLQAGSFKAMLIGFSFIKMKEEKKTH